MEKSPAHTRILLARTPEEGGKQRRVLVTKAGGAAVADGAADGATVAAAVPVETASGTYQCTFNA